MHLCIRIHVEGIVQFARQDPLVDEKCALAIERRVPGQHLEQQNAHRPPDRCGQPLTFQLLKPACKVAVGQRVSTGPAKVAQYVEICCELNWGRYFYQKLDIFIWLKTHSYMED